MNPIARTSLLFLLVAVACGVPGADGSAGTGVILIGSERIVFTTPTGQGNSVPYPCGNIPATVIIRGETIFNAPYFDGPIAPVSYVSGGVTKFRFNASAGYKNYQVISDLNLISLSFSDGLLTCAPAYTAPLSTSNSSYDWAQWLYGTFRDVPNNKVYAVMYHEYYGGIYRPPPGTPAIGALGMAVSTNNGASFSELQPAPDHIFVKAPYLWPQGGGYGWFGGIFKSPLDQMYYVGAGGADTSLTALVRTNNLNDNASWRAWDGSGFNVTTTPINQAYEGIPVNPLYLGYSDYFKKYIAVTIGSSDNYVSGNNLIVYNLSDDLIHWGPPRKIMFNPACGSDHVCQSLTETELSSYPSIMDPIYLSQTTDSVLASNGMTGAHPYVTYIKNPNTYTIHQQFATQQVSFDHVVVNRMDNFSMRGIVGDGNQNLVMGFIMVGTESKKFVFRGIGPSLPLSKNFGYPKIANPRITLYDANTNVVATNLGWTTLSWDDQNFLTSVGMAPLSTSESAIVWTLPPGAYTVRMDNGVGVGVIEGYDFSSLAEAKIAQVSMRGYSQPGNGALTMGFISRGGQTGVIRGTGTSTLAPAGFSPVVPDPYISVYDSTTQIGWNDNWGADSNALAIQYTYGLAPGNSLESATMLSTQRGGYTVIMQGTGYGLLELYNVNPN